MTPAVRLGLKIMVLALLLLGPLAYALTVGIDWSQWTGEALRARIETYGVWAPLAYIIAMTVRVMFFVPASLMLLLGMLLFGPWWGSLYIIIGTLVCASVEFGVARWLGREVVERLLARAPILLRFDHAAAQRGFQTVLLIRLIPNVPFDLQNVSFGLSPIGWRDYLLATLVALLPWCVVYAIMGETLTDLRQFWKVLVALLLIVALVWIPRWWLKRRRAA